MSIHMEFRHGFGIDFEFNENICFRTIGIDEDGNEVEGEGILCYIGHIIRLPLLLIYIGEFAPIEEMNNFTGFRAIKKKEQQNDQ